MNACVRQLPRQFSITVKVDFAGTHRVSPSFSTLRVQAAWRATIEICLVKLQSNSELGKFAVKIRPNEINTFASWVVGVPRRGRVYEWALFVNVTLSKVWQTAWAVIVYLCSIRFTLHFWAFGSSRNATRTAHTHANISNWHRRP